MTSKLVVESVEVVCDGCDVGVWRSRERLVRGWWCELEVRGGV